MLGLCGLQNQGTNKALPQHVEHEGQQLSHEMHASMQQTINQLSAGNQHPAAVTLCMRWGILLLMAACLCVIFDRNLTPAGRATPSDAT